MNSPDGALYDEATCSLDVLDLRKDCRPEGVLKEGVESVVLSLRVATRADVRRQQEARQQCLAARVASAEMLQSLM
jgi:hypothetical protein